MAMKVNTTDTPLTGRQMRVLRFIVSVYKTGRMPTYQEICTHFGWSGPNSVYIHVKPLRFKGWLQMSAREAGGPSVTPGHGLKFTARTIAMIREGQL